MKFDSGREIAIKESIVTVNDFSDFSLVTDDPNLDSTNDDTSISYSYDGSDTDPGEVIENYELHFDYYVSDFAVNLSLEHDIATDKWGSFEFFLYMKIPLGSSWLTDDLFGFSIADWDDYYGGYHSMAVKANDTSSPFNITNFGDLPDKGNTTFRIVKTGTDVHCTIIENSVTLLSIPYKTDYVDKVNTIRLKVATGTTLPEFSITVTDIEGEITILDPTPTTTPSPTETTNSYFTIFGFISLSILIMCVKKWKRKK